MIGAIGKFLTSSAIGRMVGGQMIVIALLAGMNLWQRHRISGLDHWRDTMLVALGDAVDQRDASGNILPVRASDAATHIRALGRFRADVILAREKAALADASHALAVERSDNSTTRKAADDFDARIAQARARAAHFGGDSADPGAPRTGVVRRPERAAPDDHGQGGSPAMPGLSDAAGKPHATPGGDRLPEQPCPAMTPAMTIGQRLLATEQAIQLDELINVIERFGEVER